MHRRGRKAAGRHQQQVSAPWFTRVRALLAGALVLGVGATLTLAAWTDTETARGTFTASTFGIVGSASATGPASAGSYAENTSALPAALTFSAPFGAMSPGTTVYSRFAVKTTAATGVTGKVSLAADSGNGAGLGNYLTYGVKIIADSSACNATTYAAGASAGVDAPKALTVGSTVQQNLAVAGGTPVVYCFAVTLPPGTTNAAQGSSVTATWTFTATSDS